MGRWLYGNVIAGWEINDEKLLQWVIKQKKTKTSPSVELDPEAVAQPSSSSASCIETTSDDTIPSSQPASSSTLDSEDSDDSLNSDSDDDDDCDDFKVDQDFIYLWKLEIEGYDYKLQILSYSPYDSNDYTYYLGVKGEKNQFTFQETDKVYLFLMTPQITQLAQELGAAHIEPIITQGMGEG